MKFCMECGQKSPPMAKFCPGCGTSMSLKSSAGVEADQTEEDTHDLPGGEISDIKLPKDAITVIGDNDVITLKDVVGSSPQVHKGDKGYRRKDSRLAGLSREQMRTEIHRWNTELDGSREA